MKQGISKREKIMLFLTAIIALGYLSYNFVIKPAYNSYVAKQAEYESLTYEKEELEFKLQNEQIYRDGLLRSEEGFADIKLRYISAVSSTEIDRILTRICQQNDLYPTRLGISSMPKASKDEAPTAYSVVTASMDLQGSIDSLKGLISTVDDMDYVRINRISFSPLRDSSKISSPNITVFFEVTMLNDNN